MISGVFILGVLVGLGLAVTYYLHCIPPSSGDD